MWPVIIIDGGGKIDRKRVAQMALSKQMALSSSYSAELKNERGCVS